MTPTTVKMEGNEIMSSDILAMALGAGGVACGRPCPAEGPIT